jgi:hypothetical protein
MLGLMIFLNAVAMIFIVACQLQHLYIVDRVVARKKDLVAYALVLHHDKCHKF